MHTISLLPSYKEPRARALCLGRFSFLFQAVLPFIYIGRRLLYYPLSLSCEHARNISAMEFLTKRSFNGVWVLVVFVFIGT